MVVNFAGKAQLVFMKVFSRIKLVSSKLQC